MTAYLGEIAAFGTALCWAFTSTSFESAGKKIGSMNLNLTRLFIGMLFISVYTYFTRGHLLPTDASALQWQFLMLSGFIGIVLGDLFLFEAFVRIGSRVAMLIYASVPPMTGLLAYFFLGEKMTGQEIIGMLITLFGIAFVILNTGQSEKKVTFSYPLSGILLAFGGAFGQALGYIIGKFGMGDYNAFAATQIRIIAGIIGFIVIFTIRGQWVKYRRSLNQKEAFLPLVVGSFFGPFLGISLSLYAVKSINPGVASTLIALTPVLLIPYAYFIKKEHIVLKEIAGTLIAIIGIAVMFL